MDTKKLLIAAITVAIVIGSLFAIVTIQKTLTQGQINDFINRAYGARSDGDYITAYNLLSSARQLSPDDHEITLLQANVAFLNGDFAVAQALYLESGTTQNAQLSYINALNELSRGNLDASITQLNSATNSRDTEDVVTANQISTLSTSVKDIADETNPPKIKALIVRTLITQKAYLLAIETANTLILEEKKYKDAYYLRAVAYYSIGNYSLARQDTNLALDIDPNYAAARDLLETIEK